MKISIACDHGALELKNAIKAHLEQLGHEVRDFGTHTTDSCDLPRLAQCRQQHRRQNRYDCDHHGRMYSIYVFLFSL